MHLVRVLLADDHPVVLAGLRELIAAKDGFQVAATATNGEEALRALRELKPDLAVLDVSMPDMTGLDVLAVLNSEGLDIPVVFLTATASDEQIAAAVTLGVRGIVLKDAAPDSLIQCLRTIADGGRWLPPEVVDAALSRESERRLEAHRVEQSMTSREREIALLVAKGMSNKEIGRKLSVSEGTVKIHLHNIYQKLGVSNRTSLAALALAHRDELSR
jgi:DNA-binding NarL/FixJ family response regulator